jgi:uncharacterized protein (DUF1697 family)
LPPRSRPTTYVALLRGINVGGKNVIRMDALRETLVELGLSDVRTYIQSGNVVLRTGLRGKQVIERKLEAALTERHAYAAKIVLRSLAEYRAMIEAFPVGWGDDADAKHNVVFLRPSIDRPTLIDELAPKPEVEAVIYVPGALLWSANAATISRSAMLKLSARAEYQEMTVRNLNTTRALFALMQELDERD